MKQIGSLLTEQKKCDKVQLSSSQKIWVDEIKNRYGNDENFGTLFNPDMQVKYVSTSLEKCFIGLAPSMARVKIAYGIGTAQSWLYIQIVDLCTFAGIKEKPEDKSIVMLVNSILTNYSYLKVTELMVFFQKFKAGEYGKFFGVIDNLVITDALYKFLSYRKEQLAIFERVKSDREIEEKRKQWNENSISFDEWQEIKHYHNFEIYEHKHI